MAEGSQICDFAKGVLITHSLRARPGGYELDGSLVPGSLVPGSLVPRPGAGNSDNWIYMRQEKNKDRIQSNLSLISFGNLTSN